MADRIVCPLVVGGDDGGAVGAREVGIDRHDRGVGGEGGGDGGQYNDPICDAVVEEGDIVPLFGGRDLPFDVAVGVDDEVVVVLADGAVDPFHDFDGEKLFDVGHNEADDVGAATAHAAGGQIGGVAQLVDDVSHFLVGRFGDVVFVV